VTDGDHPQLQSLTHRLSETPVEFLQSDVIDVAAIVCDQLRAMGAALPMSPAALFGKTNAAEAGMLCLAAWLLHDDWFLARRHLAAAMVGVFSQGFASLSEWVTPSDVVKDADRREEFVRLVLTRLELRPEDETEEQAADHLGALDSAERVRVARRMRDAEARARKVRQEMACKAAEAAAARYSPE
jgi:hypothetical protein